MAKIEQDGSGVDLGANAREPLSVCIICCDEEDNIRDCLESVRWADEIVVVDSGSTDKTVSIAREFTQRVIQRSWPGYVDQKNFASDQASHDWVLSIDADERVSAKLMDGIERELARICRGESDVVGYTMPRCTFYLGRWIRHGGWYPDRKLRLFDRRRGRWEGLRLHERLEVDGPTAELKGDLQHYTYRDIADHLATINKFTTLAAEEMVERRKRMPLVHMLINPPLAFLKTFVFRLGFLDGVVGFVIAVLASYYVFLKYAKLWELRKKAE